MGQNTSWVEPSALSGPTALFVTEGSADVSVDKYGVHPGPFRGTAAAGGVAEVGLTRGQDVVWNSPPVAAYFMTTYALHACSHLLPVSGVTCWRNL